MRTPGTLSPKHLLLTFLIVLIWGINFIAIYIGLKDFPPFLLSALRFGLAAIPWVFFFPKPEAPVKLILGYGLFTFAMQFGFLFSGIHLGLSPGLASLVLQIQVFFSIGLAYLFFQDKPGIWKVIGSLISFIGIGIVASYIEGGGSFLGLILTLLGAFSWASGNMFTKKINAKSPLSLVIWGNLAAFPPMMILSLIFEGPTAISHSLQNMSLAGAGALLFIAYISTHIGYAAWGFLLKTYSTSAVVPFTLMIPVVGFLSSALFLGEELTMWKLVASMFILGGVVFNLLEKHIRKLITR